MRSAMSSMVALAGLLGALPALPDKTPIGIKTDLEGEYFFIDMAGTANNPVLVVKRVSLDFTYYIKREFD